MKNIKNVVKKGCLFGVVMSITIFVINIFSMRMTPQQVKRGQVAAKQVMAQMKQRKNQYFIHEANNLENGIWVDKQFVNNNSKSIKNMVEDFGEELNAIPLSTSLEIIKLGFDLLRDKKDVKYLSDVNHLSFEEWVDVANLFNFLDVSEDKLKAVLVKIKETIDSNPNNIASNQVLKKLNIDLQELIVPKQNIVDCLKDCIAQKFTQHREKSLVGHPDGVNTVAFSTDGTKIVSGCEEGTDNLIVWDVSDLENIVKYSLVGHPSGVSAVAFSPDGKYVISSSVASNLIVWDISDLNNITHKILAEGQYDYRFVAFSSDGKNVFAWGTRLDVWDINGLSNITHQPRLADLTNFGQLSLPLSPDGTLLAGVHRPSFDIFTILDVSGPKSLEYKSVEKNFGEMLQFAFSPDGKNIVSYGDKLVVWDISDLNNITGKVLVDNVADLGMGRSFFGMLAARATSMIFSHDGKKIALGHRNGFILLDINDVDNRIVVDKFGVFAMSFSPNDKQIVTGGRSGMFIRGNNLSLWTLLTHQEEVLLNQIKNYNSDQAWLIYQLCLQSSKKQKIELKKGSEEEQIFKTLPEDMQKLLIDLFLPEGWLSGWWS